MIAYNHGKFYKIVSLSCWRWKPNSKFKEYSSRLAYQKEYLALNHLDFFPSIEYIIVCWYFFLLFILQQAKMIFDYNSIKSINFFCQARYICYIFRLILHNKKSIFIFQLIPSWWKYDVETNYKNSLTPLDVIQLVSEMIEHSAQLYSICKARSSHMESLSF